MGHRSTFSAGLEDPEQFVFGKLDNWYVSGGQVYINGELYEPGACPKCGGPMGFRKTDYDGPCVTCYNYPECSGMGWFTA